MNTYKDSLNQSIASILAHEERKRELKLPKIIHFFTPRRYYMRRFMSKMRKLLPHNQINYAIRLNDISSSIINSERFMLWVDLELGADQCIEIISMSQLPFLLITNIDQIAVALMVCQKNASCWGIFDLDSNDDDTEEFVVKLKRGEFACCSGLLLPMLMQCLGVEHRETCVQLESHTEKHTLPASLQRLTELLLRGHSLLESADIMKLSPDTVRNYYSRLRNYYGVPYGETLEDMLSRKRKGID